MAGNRQQFTLQFNADTTQARKALQDLNNSLNAMMKLQHFDSGLHQDITEAADAARVLQQELQKATNVNTGKLNISDFARGLSQAGTSLNELSNKLLQAGQTGQMAFNHLAQSIVAAEVPMKKMNATLSNALTTLKNTIKWEVSSTFVHGLESAFSGAVSYAKNLNTSLTNIRIVTGQSVDDMAKFAVQANKAAKELSTTTKAYADASLIYYQQGDSAEAAAKKAAITIKAANASFGTSAAEMSEYLTSVWNSYKVGADELERYVDIMAALGAKTATSLEEIATSMQKVAATANTVGVSMEQVSSIISTVSSVTRESAESIGTSYKTIFARIGDLKLGGTTEDGVGLGQVSSQLESIGVKILDTQGNLRDMGDIITDLGNKWQTMSEAQKTATAQVVAGKRQYTQLMALFENWDMYNQNLNIAENADGELQKMADIYAESWEAASARVQASLEGIYGKLINDQALIKMTNMLADFIGGIESVIEGLGGLPGVLATVGNVATTIFRSKIAAGFNSMAKSVTDWGKSLQGKGFFGGLGSILKGESAAMREYQKLLKDLQVQSSMQTSAAQTPTEEMKWDSTQRIIEAKQKLLSIEQNLSEAERAASQHQINSAVEALNALEQMTMEYEEQNKSIQKLIKSTSSLEAQQKGQSKKAGHDVTMEAAQKKTQKELNNWFKGSNQFAFGEGQNLQKATASNIFNTKASIFDTKVRKDIALFNTELSRASVSADKLVKRFADLRQGMQGFDSSKSGILDVLNHLEKTDQISTSASRLDTILDNLKQSLKGTDINTSFIDDLRQKIQAAAHSGDLNTFKEAVQEAFNTLKTTSANASTSASGALQFLVRVLNLSEEELVELGEQAGLSAEQLRRLAEAARNADQNLDNINISGGKFGKVMANIINGCTAVLSSFESMSSAMENWDTSNLTSKISSIGNTVLNVAGQFATGNWVGGIMSTIGAGVGYLVGQAEAAKKAAKELEEANQQRLKDNIDTNAAENDSLAQLITSFNTLYAQKKEGINVDAELASVAQKLAAQYDITGAAVASLTGNYDQLILRLRDIANGTWDGQAGDSSGVETARNNFLQAQGRLENNSAQDGSTNPSMWQTLKLQEHGYVTSSGTDTEQTVLFGGTTHSRYISSNTPLEGDNLRRYNNAQQAGLVLPEESYRTLIAGTSYSEFGVSGATYSIGTRLPTYEFNTSTKETDQLTDKDGRSVNKTFREVIQDAGMDDYFLNDAGYAELMIGDNSSAAYKLSLYEGLIEMRDEMDRLGVDVSNAYYQGINSIITTLSGEMEIYKAAVQEYGDAIINQEANRFLGRTAGQDKYNFDAFWNDYTTTYTNFTQAFTEIYGNTKTPEEIAEMAQEASNTVLQMNSGLSAYSSALNAAYEIYGDMNKAAAALSDLENQGYALEDVDYNILQAHLRGDTDYIDAIVNADKKKQAYEDSIATYEGAIKGQSLLKENMSFDEMTQLYDSFSWGEDGIIAWEDFYEKSYEEKAAYLESLSDKYLESSREAAENARIAAETEETQAKQARDTFTGIGDEQYTNKQIKEAAAQDAINDEAYSNWLNKWYKNEEGNWTLREGAVFTKTDNAINDAYGQWIKIEGNRERGLDAFVADQQAAGANGISQAVIDEYNRLVAEAEAAGIAVDEALRNEMLWKAMGSQVDSVTQKVQNLVNAITSLPTDGEELRKIADALGWDVNKLVNSTEAERAAAVAAMDAPTLAKSGTETYTDWVNVPKELLEGEKFANATLRMDADGQYQRAVQKTRSVSTDQDYADYGEQIRLYQEANALNAQYIEQGIQRGAIETLATIEELSSALSSIDISNLPEQGTKAYEQLQKALAKVNISMADFMKMNDSSKYAAIAKAQNKLISEEITVNEQLKNHYASIMNDSDRYDEATRMEATQNYYDAVTEGNNLMLQQEQNIANARAQAAEVYAQQADMAKARMEEAKKEAEELKTVAEEMADAIETGELSETAKQTLSQAGYLDDWEKAATAAERAAVASKFWSQYAADTTTAGQKLSAAYSATADLLTKKGQAVQWDNQTNVKSKDGESVFDLQNKEDYLQYLQDYTNMTEEQLGHIEEAWGNLEAKGIDLSKMTNAEITKALADELVAMGVEVDKAWQMAAANARDAMADIGKSMAQDHIEAAQTAADAWLDAFNQIAEARKTLLSGGSLLEKIAGDPAQILQYAKASGLDPKEVAKQIMTGDLTASQLQYGSYDDFISTQMAQYGLDLQTPGKTQFGTKSVWYDTKALGYSKKWNADTHKLEWADTDGNFVSQETINGALEEYYTAILQTTGLTETQAQKLAKQIISGEANYSLLSGATDDLTEAIEASADAQELYTTQQEALTGAQAKVTEIVENGANTVLVNGVQGDQEELTKLDAALERAQAEGAKEDANWENLSAEDRDLLASYGITSFDQVDSAATQCASALATLADVAYKAAETFIKSEEGGKYTQNENGEWGTTDAEGNFQVDKEMTKYMEELDEARQDSNYHQEDVQTRTDDYGAQSNGFANKQEWEDYAQYLYEVNDGQGKLAEQTEELRKEYTQLAATANKISKAWDDLTGSQKTNIKTLKTAQKGSNEYRKALGSLTKSIKTIFGDATNVTEDFVEAHLEDIEKMAEGDEEAAERVEKALLDDMLGELSNKEVTIDVDADGVEDQLTTVGDLLNTFGDEFSDQPIGFEITADESPALQALNNIMAVSAAAGNDISENIQSALDAIGWEPELEYQVMNAEGKMVGTTSARIRVGDSYETANGTMETMTEGMYLIPVIKGTKKTGGGASGRKLPSSNGGGGGGGGKPKKIDKKKPEDEKERYHETEQTLDRLADELEKVDKLKSRAYGKGHLDAIKQEIDLLKQEVGVQADYLRQAKEYLTIDRNRVASLGATFNADGTISNYDELMDSIIAKYNAFVDKYNSSTAKQQENMEEEKEKMDEWYEESIEWISQYEETLNLTRDKENEIIELQNEISAKTLEDIQYKIEIEVELNDAETEFLDYLNEKYSETLEKQGLLVENLVREQRLAQENLAALNTAKTELDAKYASGELTQADYVEGLKDINDQILDNLSTLEELRKEIQEAYGNALDLATEKIDNHTEKMENASAAMQSYISIMGLLGQGIDYEKINEFYEQQYEYNLASLETQQQYLDALKEEEAYYLAKMASGELTEIEREQFEALQDTIASVQDGILSKTEETLSALKEAFSSMVSGILRDFEESIAGAGNSLEDLAADYEYYLEVQERNVSTSKELYEVSKLNRQIEQDIADTSSSVYKQRLAALQEEIKAKSADRALTEYDIQMMNLEYELLQRQMALEEAKSAKDTVRLTRDSSGNYVYQYTANQDAVNEAQQGVEDVLQRMAEANAERVGQLEQETINAYQDMVAQIEEIANSEVLTQEEKNAKIAEIVARTQEKMGWIQKQYTIATENTALTYERIQDQYGKKMADAAQMTKDSMNGTIGEIINKTNEFSLNMQSVQGAVAEQLKLLQGNMDAVLTTTKWNEAAESIKDYDAVIEDAQKDAHNMIMTLGGENGLLTNIRTTTAAWDLQSKAIENLITYYEQLYKSILKIQQTESTKTPAAPDIPTPSTPPANDNPETDIPVDDAPEEEPTRSYPYGKASETSGKIKSGAKGDQVRAIQYALNELGYGNSGTNGLDGIFGTGTKKAVKAFQEANGITVDGIVNNKTREKFKMLQFLTGGLVDYTGPAWVDGTKNHPELMLNASDTENMLAAVQTVRSLDTATLMLLDDFIKLATSSMLSVNSLHATGVHNTDQELQQQVHITAEFPNVQDSNEIQDAFDNLINRAAQFVGSIKK